jgi:hypothetical protein
MPYTAHPAARPAFLGTVPQAKYRGYKGPKDTLEMMASHALGKYGERSIIVRRFTEWIVGQIAPKGYLDEILAIRNCFVQPSPTKPWVPLMRYTNDPLHVEFIRTPERCVRDIMEQGFCTIDCDESSCLAATMALQVGRVAEFVAMGFAPNVLSHVAVRVKEPKTGRWIILDGVAGPREKEAAGKAQEILFKSLD